MLAADLLRVDASPLKYRDLAIPGWPDIDPVTVLMALNDAASAHGVELKQEVVDKVHAVQTLLVNPVAYGDAYTFEKTAEALNGLIPHFGYFPVILAPARLAVAVTAMTKLKPENEWGVSVKRYCREVLREQGVMSFPPSMVVLAFADPEDRMAGMTLTDEQQSRQKEHHEAIESYVKEALGNA